MERKRKSSYSSYSPERQKMRLQFESSEYIEYLKKTKQEKKAKLLERERRIKAFQLQLFLVGTLYESRKKRRNKFRS